MFNKRILFAGVFLVTAAFCVSSQEALKSTEEEYYDFLALEGIVQRPALGYRTLSDSVWVIPDNAEGNIWSENNLGTTKDITGHISYKLFGPDWYNSFNTAAPYGQNDGALWQGKGYNTSLTAGARLEAYGFEVTLKPQLSFSQNLDFDIMTADSHYGSKYAYFWYGSIDYPQRFGDSPFFTFDWGDTEIRYTWKTITIGFGTQSIWLGPAYLNPLLSSNNAGTYPKIDFGIRKTALYIPFAGWYLGDIEARMWLGYLTESDYFDNDPSNDHNLFNGLSLAYAPSFIKGFTIGFNKVCLSKWGKDSWKYLNPFYDTNDYEDQKASITTNFLLPKGNIELYSELAIDDYFQGGFIQGLSRYPFDSLSAVFGFKKSFSFYNLNKIKGEIIFEFCSCEEPWNKVSAKQKYAFNFHYQITQGYTNKGQAIGTSLGNGGNGQYFCFKLFFPKGESNFYLYRFNPDDTYMYFTENNENQYYKGELVLGTKIIYYVLPSISIGGGLGYDWIINPYYATSNISYINNFIFTFEVKYIL